MGISRSLIGGMGNNFRMSLPGGKSVSIDKDKHTYIGFAVPENLRDTAPPETSTHLSLAVKTNEPELVELLLRHGADPGQKDSEDE